MEIKLYINGNAKKQINSIVSRTIRTGNKLEPDFYLKVNRWIEGDIMAKCYILRKDGDVKSFALFTRSPYDPQKEHSNPYMLDYIYTFPSERRKGYAQQILRHSKESDQVTAFSIDETSSKLLESVGYLPMGSFEEAKIYRYP